MKRNCSGRILFRVYVILETKVWEIAGGSNECNEPDLMGDCGGKRILVGEISIESVTDV